MLSQSYLHVYVMARQLKKEFLAHTSLVVSKSSLSYCDVCIVNSTSKACMFVNRNKLQNSYVGIYTTDLPSSMADELLHGIL